MVIISHGLIRGYKHARSLAAHAKRFCHPIYTSHCLGESLLLCNAEITGGSFALCRGTDTQQQLSSDRIGEREGGGAAPSSTIGKLLFIIMIIICFLWLDSFFVAIVAPLIPWRAIIFPPSTWNGTSSEWNHRRSYLVPGRFDLLLILGW